MRECLCGLERSEEGEASCGKTDDTGRRGEERGTIKGLGRKHKQRCRKEEQREGIGKTVRTLIETTREREAHEDISPKVRKVRGTEAAPPPPTCTHLYLAQGLSRRLLYSLYSSNPGPFEFCDILG